MRATLERQAVLIAAGASIVGLAVVAGVALTMNLLLSLVYQQRRRFAALRAQGASTSTLVGIVGTQSLLLGLGGSVLGVALTVPAVRALNLVAASLVGFEDVVSVQPRVLAVGVVAALAIGVAGGLVAGWRVSRLSPLEQLTCPESPGGRPPAVQTALSPPRAARAGGCRLRATGRPRGGRARGPTSTPSAWR